MKQAKQVSHERFIVCNKFGQCCDGLSHCRCSVVVLLHGSDEFDQVAFVVHMLNQVVNDSTREERC